MFRLYTLKIPSFAKGFNRQTVPVHIIFRQFRRVPKYDDHQPRRLKVHSVTLNDEFGEKFGDPANYGEINRKLKKMFTDMEEMPTEYELEDEPSTVIANADQMYDMHVREEKASRTTILYQILERKDFKKSKETNLLTIAAKQQIRYLHQLDPLEWSPEILAQSFPISVLGVKKLLKNKYYYDNEEKRKFHDEEVENNWKILKSNRDLSSISPVTVKLWKEGKLVQDFYAGNFSLPVGKTDKKENKKVTSKKVGEHLAIVQKYLDLIEKSEEKKSVTSSLGTDSGEKESEITANEVVRNILPDFVPQYPTAGEVEDEISASYLSAEKQDDLEPDMLHSQFKENLMEEFSTKKYKTPADEAYLDWMKKNTSENSANLRHATSQCYDAEDFVGKIQKYNRDSVGSSIDNSNSEQNVHYLYNKKLGYQCPSEEEFIKDHITIPSHLYKKGALYQVKNCIYDDDGEFLYKLPS